MWAPERRSAGLPPPRGRAAGLTAALVAGVACTFSSPQPVEPADARGLVLHVSPRTLLVQHDDLRNRVVPGVERYHGDGLSAVGPGDEVDLWFGDGGRVERLVVTGRGELAAGPVQAGHTITGTVVRVDGGRVTLDHEPVADVMGAMVMGFGLAPWESSELQVGDRVQGELVRSDHGWQLAAVERIGRGDATLRSDVAPLEPGQQLARLELIGDDGEPLVVGEGQGVPTLVTFIYTRCPDASFCPAIAQRMRSLQERLERGRIVTVTLDPEHDTPEVLRAWGTTMGSDLQRWRLATLSPLQLQRLALLAGQFVTVDGGRISHLHRVLVLDENGTLIERYDSNDWPMDRVVRQLAGLPP